MEPILALAPVLIQQLHMAKQLQRNCNFGAELPLTLELYAYTNVNIERDYFFFIGFGVTSGYYAIREFDNLGGIGPHFVLGGNVLFLRGEIGYKGSFTYYRKSLQATLRFLLPNWIWLLRTISFQARSFCDICTFS